MIAFSRSWSRRIRNRAIPERAACYSRARCRMSATNDLRHALEVVEPHLARVISQVDRITTHRDRLRDALADATSDRNETNDAE